DDRPAIAEEDQPPWYRTEEPVDEIELLFRSGGGSNPDCKQHYAEIKCDSGGAVHARHQHGRGQAINLQMWRERPRSSGCGFAHGFPISWPPRRLRKRRGEAAPRALAGRLLMLFPQCVKGADTIAPY